MRALFLLDPDGKQVASPGAASTTGEGVWRFADLGPKIGPEARLLLFEGLFCGKYEMGNSPGIWVFSE